MCPTRVLETLQQIVPVVHPDIFLHFCACSKQILCPVVKSFFFFLLRDIKSAQKGIYFDILYFTFTIKSLRDAILPPSCSRERHSSVSMKYWILNIQSKDSFKAYVGTLSFHKRILPRRRKIIIT